MGIYTGGMRMYDEKVAAAKRIAKQQAKAEAGEAKRKGRAGIFGKLAGMGLGHVAGLALAGVTGGIVNPLTLKLAQAAISGGSMWAGRAAAHQATTGKWGKALKTSGQVDKIEAGGKYGYGREEAATLSKALAEETKSKEDLGTLGTSIAGSFAADIAGDYAGNLTKTLKGGKGAVDPSTIGLEASLEGSGLDLEQYNSMVDTAQANYIDDDTWDVASSVTESPDYQGLFFEREEQPLLGPGQKGAEGGQVMDQHTMIGLALLSQMQQQQEQTAYSGTPLEEKQQPSTIADMFASQGKTLGGNNTQSLSQMLGR